MSGEGPSGRGGGRSGRGRKSRARQRKNGGPGRGAGNNPRPANNPNRNRQVDNVKPVHAHQVGVNDERRSHGRNAIGKHGANLGSHPTDASLGRHYNPHLEQLQMLLPPPQSKKVTKRNSKNSKGSQKQLQNGEKGAEAHTVSEEYRIKFTDLLINFREDDTLTEIKLPPKLTNTERKFMHQLAGGLGLTSKSTGKGDDRYICVSKPKKNGNRIASGDVSDGQRDESLPMLHVGVKGIRSLQEHVNRYAATQVEIAESRLTGSSLMDNTEQDESKNKRVLQALDELGINAKDARTNIYAPKKVNMNKRTSLHEKAQMAKMQNKNYQTFLNARSKLPAYEYREVIASAVLENQVVVISGATGCGKSTQVPQFLLDDPRIGPTASIAVTQPRRISAISVSERVAAERGEDIGLTVGYHVRLESEFTDATQMRFITPGILLRKLLSDPNLSEYTHVIIDEVHERDKYTEFLMIALRDLLETRSDLRVILMSATLQTQILLDYWRTATSTPPEICIPGRTFPVQEFFLEDILKMTGFDTSVADSDRLENDLASILQQKGTTGAEKALLKQGNSLTCIMCNRSSFRCPEELGAHVALCNGGGNISMEDLETKILNSAEVFAGFDEHLMEAVEKSDEEVEMYDEDESENGDDEEFKWDGESLFLGGTSTQNTLAEEEALGRYQASHNDDDIDYDLLLDIIKYIDQSSYGDGAVLVFLPGWQEISQFSLLLGTTVPFNNALKYLTLPLHSGIPSKDQRRCFARPPIGVRKIILSTNIAETSVTIDDIAFVIDSGRMKEKSYDPHLKTSTLQPVWISQASAKQRTGRAGRTKAGVSFRLYTRNRFTSLKCFQESELLRTPLEEMCLQSKKLNLAPGGPEDHDGIPAFLMKALTPPHPKSVDNALQLLVDLGAMDLDSNELTDLGNCLSVLSLEPRVGKMVIWSYLLGCAQSAVTAGVSMSYKSPFILPPPHLRRNADSARVSLSEGSESDQITVLNCLRYFDRTLKRGTGQANGFCHANFLSFPTMKMIADIRKNTARELVSVGLPNAIQNGGFHNRGANDEALMQASITAGLYPNVASRVSGEFNFSTKTNRKAKVHVSSINSCKGQPLASKCTKSKGDVEFIIFGELVRGVGSFTMSQTTHLVSPLPLLLLCGELRVRPAKVASEEYKNMSVLSVDDWILFLCDSDVATNLVILRKRLNRAFLKLVSKGIDSLESMEKDAVTTLSAVLRSSHFEMLTR